MTSEDEKKNMGLSQVIAPTVRAVAATDTYREAAMTGGVATAPLTNTTNYEHNTSALPTQGEKAHD